MMDMTATQLLANTARSISRLNANGTAKVQGEQIILTEDKPDQVGSAFLGLPIELREIILTTTFVIKHQGKDGADGMAIVLHSDSRGAKALGQGGCDLGYGGLTNCLVVEIDTYRSVDRCDDPPTPHISIHAAGGQAVSAHHRFSLWCSKPGAIPNVDDGRQYTLRLELSCSRKALRIFFNDSTAGDFVELTDQPVIIASMPETGYEFFGWTAATGGLHQSHVISDFNLWQGCNQEDVQ